MFFISDLRKKLFFTLGVLIVDRLGAYIPVAGINVSKLSTFLEQSKNLGNFFSYIDTLSGGALGSCTLFALGISPYITASIAMQLLGMSIPKLEALMKEGEYGKKVINQYTRYLALGLSIFWSFSYSMLLESQGLVLTPGWGFRISFILSLAAGSMFIMWLGEQISMFGLGNGASIIIFAGIIARFPSHVMKTLLSVQSGYLNPLIAIFIAVAFLAIIGCIVFLEKGERKIPVQYARRMVGRRVYGAQSTFIPFKINTVGVMPVIFASTFLQLPLALIGMLANRLPSLAFLADIVSPKGAFFNILEFGLIIFFTYFYTALVFNPDELADNLRKGGGFIPGVRPGKSTAKFFDYILNRIGLVGAVYLATLAIIPNIMIYGLDIPFYMGGTALLIVVGVALETSSQVESYLIEHNYEGFLSTGRVRR
jgi:preprotein translocase subunit SecY